MCINSVYAYFSATAEREFTLNFATLELDLQNSSGSGYTAATLTNKINGAMPGDVIDFSDIHVKNTGTGDAYVLVNAIIEISKSGMPTLTYNNWYNLAGGKVNVSNFAANVAGATNLTSGSSNSFNLSWTIPGETVTNSYQEADIKVTVDAHAVQSYLPEAEVYQSESLYASYFIIKEAYEEQPLNLLNLEDRVVRSFGTTNGAPETRNITENSIYVGVSQTNYYRPTDIISYSINDGVIGVQNSSISFGLAFNVEVSPNTKYTLSVSHNNSTQINCSEYDASGTHLGATVTNKGDITSVTFTTKNSAKWLMVIFKGEPAGSLGTFSNIQLVEGSTATGYTPYINLETEPLMKVGSVQDVYDASTGVVTRNVGKIVFDGTEDWVEYNASGEGVSFQLNLDDSKMGFQTSVCNMFENYDEAWMVQNKDKVGIYSDHNVNARKYFRPPNTSVVSLEQWKVWLAEQYAAGNPVILWYQLAAPITE